MPRSQCCLANGQRAFESLLHLGVLACAQKRRSEQLQTGRDIDVIGSQLAFANRERTLSEWNRLGKSTSLEQLVDCLVQVGGGFRSLLCADLGSRVCLRARRIHTKKG